jgi:acyl-CoA synthetase (AMP-forming)/AMP-acid ligase II
MTIMHQLIAAQQPDDIAMILDVRPVSFGLLNKWVDGAAAWLSAAGISRGDCVALSLSDAVRQTCLSLGLMKLGAVRSTLDPRLPTAEFDDLARRMKVGFLVSDNNRPVRSGVKVLRAASETEMQAFSTQTLNVPPPGEDDLALLVHGSGTTGQPKIMPLRHRHILARQANYQRCFPLARRDKSLILQRHTTIAYFARSMHALCNGGCLVEVSEMRSGTQDYFGAMASAIDHHTVDHLSCTAFHAKGLIDYLETRSAAARFPALKSLNIGASPVSDALRREIIARVTPNLCINYGTNEAGLIAWAGPEFLKEHFSSVGRTAPFTRIEVLGPKGEQLGPGEEGVVVVRGPCVIDGYADDDAATAKAFSDGWFRTGDRGYVDGAGAVYLLGRADDMMIIDGTNIYPAEIERVIDLMPEVKESAAVGVYSDLGRDHIVAFVVLRAPCNEARIIQRCRQVQGWKSPHRVVFVKSLPRNFAGKVLRRELVKLAGARKSP